MYDFCAIKTTAGGRAKHQNRYWKAAPPEVQLFKRKFPLFIVRGSGIERERGKKVREPVHKVNETHKLCAESSGLSQLSLSHSILLLNHNTDEKNIFRLALDSSFCGILSHFSTLPQSLLTCGD
jgi:hypothetical protein